MHHLKFGLRIDCNTTTAGRKRSYARPVKIEASLRAVPPFAAAFPLRPESPRRTIGSRTDCRPTHAFPENVVSRSERDSRQHR